MYQLFRALSLMLISVPLWSLKASSQISPSLYDKGLQLPSKLFKQVGEKTVLINDGLTRQTNKYLQRLAKEEKKLKRKLAKKDSTAASQIFGDVEGEYKNLQSKLTNPSGQTDKLLNKYIPHLDTLKTAFKFLEKTDGLLNNSPEGQAQVKQVLSKIELLEGTFNQVGEIKKYLRQRRELLQGQMDKFGLANQFKKFKKEVYHYQAEVEEYKEMFNDPSKLEAKAMELLKGSSLFKNFFNQNSQLAQLFGSPTYSAANSTVGSIGLQSRGQMEKELGQRFGIGTLVPEAVSKNLQVAKNELNQLKDKINRLGGENSYSDLPDFKLNSQRAKRFRERLELGTDFQTVKSTRYFPNATNLGFSLGYKINDNSVLGLGGSYKLGIGRDIRHVSVSHQGIGLRSFLDWKIKGNFYVSAGYEMNYQRYLSNFDQLYAFNNWTTSGLIGISKRYTLNNKIKGNIKILYDFFHKDGNPQASPLSTRVGYNF